MIYLILSEFKFFLGCDLINCFSTDSSIKIKDVQIIDYQISQNYFKDKVLVNLNQNPEGILIFFPNQSKIIKSYILLKINFLNHNFIISMGSRDKNKFSPHQQVDLIEYLINIIEIQLKNFK